MAMNIDQLAGELRDILQDNLVAEQTQGAYRVTPMLWGPPGVGKSSIVKQAAHDLGYTLVDIRLSTLSNLDVRGVPYVDQSGMWGELIKVVQGAMDQGDFLSKHEQNESVRFRFIPPPFLPQKGDKCLLFFDEVNTAPPSNQVVAYEIGLDYALGGVQLPEGTLVVMAGNRAEDKGATYEMPRPLKNRLWHADVDPDVDAFMQYGIAKGLSDDVLAFVKFRPGLLYAPPSGAQNAFPSPRTWEMLSGWLTRGKEPTLIRMAGLIGEGAAAEFLAFRKTRNELPNIDDILDKGQVFDHKDKSVLYAYTVGLSSRFMFKLQDKNYKLPVQGCADNFLKALNVLPEEMMTLGLFLIKKNAMALTNVVRSGEFRKLTSNIKSVLM